MAVAVARFGPALDRRGPELRPRVRLQTLRRGVLLHDGQGRLVADVVDDAVSVLRGRRVVNGFREIEVGTTPDTPPGLLDAIVDRLRAVGAGAPDSTPKYLRAIGGPEAAPPEIPVAELSRSASLAEVITHALATALGA